MTCCASGPFNGTTAAYHSGSSTTRNSRTWPWRSPRSTPGTGWRSAFAPCPAVTNRGSSTTSWKGRPTDAHRDRDRPRGGIGGRRLRAGPTRQARGCREGQVAAGAGRLREDRRQGGAGLRDRGLVRAGGLHPAAPPPRRGLRARAGGRVRDPARRPAAAEAEGRRLVLRADHGAPLRLAEPEQDGEYAAPCRHPTPAGRQGIGDPGEAQALSPLARGMTTPRPPFRMAGGCRGASDGRVLILAPDDSV